MLVKEKLFAQLLGSGRHLSICPLSRKPRFSNMHNVTWHMAHVEGLVRSGYAPGSLDQLTHYPYTPLVPPMGWDRGVSRPTYDSFIPEV